MAETAEVLVTVAMFSVALSWVRSKVKDETTQIAHGIVIDTLSDSDLVRRIESETGRNIREQLTVEELQELRHEVDLIDMGDDRN